MKLALVGATGIVGEQILELLSKRSFPSGELRLFASVSSDGEFIEYCDESLLVGFLSEESFVDIDLAVFATPEDVSREWMPQASKSGAICIDLSAHSRGDESCSMLVAGVNIDQLSGAKISSPSSLTVQLAQLLNSLTGVAKPASLLVTAVSSASEKGRKGIAELQTQTGELLNGRPAVSKIFPAQLAFNCLPSVETGQGLSVERDLRRILDAAELDMQINSLQLPMFYGEGAFIRLGFKEPLAFTAFKEALEAGPGISVLEGEELPSPLDAIGDEDMLVQLFEPQSESSVSFDLWYAADNLSCGGAGNVVRLIDFLATKLN